LIRERVGDGFGREHMHLVNSYADSTVLQAAADLDCVFS
jgi:hypothetical protein